MLFCNMSSDKKDRKKNEDVETFIGIASRDATEKLRTRTSEQPLFETRDAVTKSRRRPSETTSTEGSSDKSQ